MKLIFSVKLDFLLESPQVKRFFNGLGIVNQLESDFSIPSIIFVIYIKVHVRRKKNGPGIPG